MARKQPESDNEKSLRLAEITRGDDSIYISENLRTILEPVELPPQGIGPERKMSLDDKIVELIKDSTGEAVGVGIYSNNSVELTFRRTNSRFDKHDADGVMWNIHWLLGELETKLNCWSLNEAVDITVRVTIPKSSFNHLCDELQGVEHED